MQDELQYPTEAALNDEQRRRGEALFLQREGQLHRRMDKLFAWLMPCQWLFGIGCALVVSPRTWAGEASSVHVHLWAAIFLGGLISFFPLFLVWRQPGERLTRHVIAASQVMMSALLIHLTGGRIETHFHVFGSLAFLTFYRDWQVLVTATVIVAADHFFRGVFFPQSVYGILTPSTWRWLEHAAWVLFEDVFLLFSCVSGRREMRDICMHSGALEMINVRVEAQVTARTAELAQSHADLDAQRAKSLEAARLAALGEMAGGVAHEINNPLAIIYARSQHIQTVLTANPPNLSEALRFAKTMESTAERIASIVRGLKAFARSGDHDPFVRCDAGEVLSDTLALCSERLRTRGIALKVVKNTDDAQFKGRAVQISQVLLNLLNNACDAVEGCKEKWIRVAIDADGDALRISVTDSGPGVPSELTHRVMEPFFTTKGVGKGTGLGLSISKGIVESHGGTLTLDLDEGRTRFSVVLPWLGAQLRRAG